ncbi:hypothetical protein K503DRAFT_859434 [Rhizopogon vinicolor AM-OR11-026]|uniref:Uncharacterized protein n=1 Tax=Rhizopogon vinicolor AM-OR11-026 TaxID=1314800 RepID=A0A1B7MN66_9AGAM|nr:hypothetical protein K503DRAFT_859434 [Rhizopogon vinicolor AM-OR11-026]
MSEDEMKLIFSGDSIRLASLQIQLKAHCITWHCPSHKRNYSDLVFSDELVPTTVLALIPADIAMCFARKFVEGAQLEMVDAAQSCSTQPHRCHTRTRRSGHIHSRRRGSALILSTRVPTACRSKRLVQFAAPSIAGIRLSSVSLQRVGIVVCNGVVRRGKEVKLPGYQRAQTVLILPAIAVAHDGVTNDFDTVQS